MPGSRVRSRRARGEARLPRTVRDADVLESFLHDAAHFPGGHAAAIATPTTEAEIAALFEYGTTRDWVQALTIVLPTGDVLDLERGDARANPDGFFDLELAGGLVRVPIPTYRMPRVPKVSAGYFSEPGMDLIDLFVGSEGTLGVITEATLRILPERPAFCLALVPFPHRAAGMAFARGMREAA